ncbi:MAG: HAMP domain-containing histidine kinase, partial [Thermoanaerobaculia bacterium]|nr:HAMP domain-containing histidine kinase [Thermoanaerobaculia bacterium]
MRAEPPQLRSSVFGKLAAIMLTMAVALLLLVTAFFVWILGPTLSRSLEPLLADYVRGVAATAPDLAAAERLSESIDLEIRYDGPAGAWATSESMPSIERARRDEGHRLLGSGHLLVVAPDGGTYLFDWSYRGKTVGAHYVLLVLLLIVMGATFATTHLVIRRLLRPLRALGGGVARLTAGELEVVLSEGTRDEFGALTRAFNLMVTRVREMIQARDRLLLDVSHELRSPLTRLRVAIDLLPDERDRARMAPDVGEMEAMIAELLELERLRAGGLRREACDLAPALRELAGRFAGQGPGVRIVALPTSLPVEADAERIRTVLRNLLDNA